MKNKLQEVKEVYHPTLNKVECGWEQTHQKLIQAQIENMRMRCVLGKMLSHYQRHGELEHSAVVLDFMPEVLNVLGGKNE